MTRRFCNIKIGFTELKRPQEFAKVRERRKRIANNWFRILNESLGHTLIGAEDDSLPEKEAYLKLIKDKRQTKADFIQANIIGRWHALMSPAWKVQEQDGIPFRVYSSVLGKGLEEINGIGWFCFICDINTFRKYPMVVDDLMPLGPDLRHGYNMWKDGKKLLHDWDISVEHFGEDFSLLPGREEIIEYVWLKTAKGWKCLTEKP